METLCCSLEFLPLYESQDLFSSFDTSFISTFPYLVFIVQNAFFISRRLPHPYTLISFHQYLSLLDSSYFISGFSGHCTTRVAPWKRCRSFDAIHLPVIIAGRNPIFLCWGDLYIWRVNECNISEC